MDFPSWIHKDHSADDAWETSGRLGFPIIALDDSIYTGSTIDSGRIEFYYPPMTFWDYVCPVLWFAVLFTMILVVTSRWGENDKMEREE